MALWSLPRSVTVTRLTTLKLAPPVVDVSSALVLRSLVGGVRILCSWCVMRPGTVVVGYLSGFACLPTPVSCEGGGVFWGLASSVLLAGRCCWTLVLTSRVVFLNALLVLPTFLVSWAFRLDVFAFGSLRIFSGAVSGSWSFLYWRVVFFQLAWALLSSLS